MRTDDLVVPAVPVELRDGEAGRILRGTILCEGRPARGGLSEVIIPGASMWPHNGIAVRLRHLADPPECRAVPVRGPLGEITIEAPATPRLVAAIEGGRKWLSIEFRSLAEHRTAGGVREIQQCLISGVAVTDRPEYHQARAEVRSRRRVLWL